ASGEEGEGALSPFSPWRAEGGACLSPPVRRVRRCWHLGSTRGARSRRVTLRAKARAEGRATVTRFKSVHPGRWDLDQSAGIQRDGEAQMATSFYFRSGGCLSPAPSLS